MTPEVQAKVIYLPPSRRFLQQETAILSRPIEPVEGIRVADNSPVSRMAFMKIGERLLTVMRVEHPYVQEVVIADEFALECLMKQGMDLKQVEKQYPDRIALACQVTPPVYIAEDGAFVQPCEDKRYHAEHNVFQISTEGEVIINARSAEPFTLYGQWSESIIIPHQRQAGRTGRLGQLYLCS